jgi:hypothetical protein
VFNISMKVTKVQKALVYVSDKRVWSTLMKAKDRQVYEYSP